MQVFAHLGLVDHRDRVRLRVQEDQRRIAQGWLCLGGGDRAPDGVGDRLDNVAAEARALRRVVATDCLPEAEPAGMQGVVEGEGAALLPAHDPADEALVLGHLLGESGIGGARGERARLEHRDTSCGP